MRYDPRIKPPQWGPLSSVNAAVRENCQRLGLPLPVWYMPHWEMAGETPRAYGLISAPASKNADDAIWYNNGLDCTTSAEKFNLDPYGHLIPTSGGTHITKFKRTGYETDNQCIFYYRKDSENNRVGSRLYAAGNYIFHGDDWTTATYVVASTSFKTYITVWSPSGIGITRYNNGSAEETDSLSNTFSEPAEFNRIGIYGLNTGGTQLKNALVEYSLYFGEQLTEDQKLTILEQPYALIQPAVRTRYFLPDAEPSEPGTGRGQLILISDGLKVMSPAAWAGVCGMSGVIRNPKLTKREMLNPLNWLRK